MATARHEGIRAYPTVIKRCDVDKSAPTSDSQAITILQHHSSFTDIIGSKPSHTLLLSATQSSQSPLFQAGCVYLPAHSELYATSRPLKTSSSNAPLSLISRVKLSRDVDTGDIDAAELQKLRPPANMPMPASASLVPPKPGNDGADKPETMLFCSQGDLAPKSGGIFLMPRGERPIPCVTDYHGQPFNSPYGAVIHADWSVWFTDTTIGHQAEFRQEPALPPQIYRYDPGTREIRAMADGFQRPVGIAIDAGRGRLYVSDAGAGSFAPAGSGDFGSSFLQSLTGASESDDVNPQGTATMYAFDIIQSDGAPFLTNRRLFAFARSGTPLQLDCDDKGNVWAACGDGIEVWSPAGSLLGVIQVPGGAASFCRAGNGEVFICAGKSLWCVRLAE